MHSNFTCILSRFSAWPHSLWKVLCWRKGHAHYDGMSLPSKSNEYSNIKFNRRCIYCFSLLVIMLTTNIASEWPYYMLHYTAWHISNAYLNEDVMDLLYTISFEDPLDHFYRYSGNCPTLVWNMIYQLVSALNTLVSTTHSTVICFWSYSIGS